jgi:hypothetical protein
VQRSSSQKRSPRQLAGLLLQSIGARDTILLLAGLMGAGLRATSRTVRNAPEGESS